MCILREKESLTRPVGYARIQTGKDRRRVVRMIENRCLDLFDKKNESEFSSYTFSSCENHLDSHGELS